MAQIKSQMLILACLVAAAGATFTIAAKETPLAPVCYDITCADIKCLPPLELRRAEGQCCPICWASDEDIALDRHTALQGPNPYLKEAHPAAPASCAGVKCFTPQCPAGEVVGHVQGRCCSSCVAR
mmetsp:Transcript_80286/g.142239  ORF Transcript_80286/g.142239 Transcript_80286/m.142239 type:complete len:126 (+) Transcript_80286:48-425(+)